MKLIQFLDRHQIPWHPVKFHRTSGPKVILPEDHACLPSSIQKSLEVHYNNWDKLRRDHFDFVGLGNDDLTAARAQASEYEHVAIDTTEVWTIDVDEEREYLKPLLDVFPWYLSACRRLPHIMFRSTTKLPVSSMDFQGDPKVEVLCGRLSFASKDAVVHNWRCGLPEVDGHALSLNKLMGSIRDHVHYRDREPTTCQCTQDVV